MTDASINVSNVSAPISLAPGEYKIYGSGTQDKKKNPLDYATKIKFIKDRPGHDTRYALNSNKIIKELKWTKKTQINDGLYKTVMWYLENRLYFKSLKKKDIIKRFG